MKSKSKSESTFNNKINKLILLFLLSLGFSFSGFPKYNSISIAPSINLRSNYPYLGAGITLNYESSFDSYISLKATISRLEFWKNIEASSEELISNTNILCSINSLIGYEYLFLDLGAGFGISVESNSTSPIINIQTGLRYIIENFFIMSGLGITRKINNDSKIFSLYFGIGVQFD